MKHHVETHMEGDNFQCKICGEKKKTRESIRSHSDRRHMKDKKMIRKTQFLFEREQTNRDKFHVHQCSAQIEI